MTGLPVPAKFAVDGTRPAQPVGNAKSRACKECLMAQHEHSGRTCGCCGFAVEHHGPNAKLDFAECLAGRQRMAGARFRAGVDLNDLDRAALAAAERKVDVS